MIIHPSFAMEGWENDNIRWPQIVYTIIFSCFINSAATVGEVMKCSKTLLVMRFHTNNKSQKRKWAKRKWNTTFSMFSFYCQAEMQAHVLEGKVI